MEDRLWRSLPQRLIWLLSLFALAGTVISPGVRAQSNGVDTQAPVIDIEELASGTADRRQVFTVLIEEDVQLQSVTLFHRRSGELPYESAPMQAVGDSNYYSASIDTDITDLRPIEYYVMAVDTSNNRTLGGFAFDPYRRTLQPSPTPLGTTSAPNPAATVQTPAGENEQAGASRPIWQRRWFQITLGLVAAGVVVSLADGGDEDDTRIVPLTFNLQ